MVRTKQVPRKLSSVGQNTSSIIKRPGVFVEKQNEDKTLQRYRPGSVAIRDIRKYQKGSDLLINKTPFRRLVREIATDVSLTEYRFAVSTFDALQEAAEAYLVRLFKDCGFCAKHRHAATITVKDMRLAQRIAAPH